MLQLQDLRRDVPDPLHAIAGGGRRRDRRPQQPLQPSALNDALHRQLRALQQCSQKDIQVVDLEPSHHA